MRILFVSANPHWTSRLDLGDEMRELLNSLQGQDVKLMLLPAAQPEDLKRAVETSDIEVVHFSGHATKDDGIFLRKDDGTKVPVSGSDLRDLFKDKGIKLAVLNACSTQATADEIADTVGVVIGTKDVLNDEAAKKMTKVLYSSLRAGSPVEQAFDAAGKTIEDSGLTNVYMRAGTHGDEALFPEVISIEGDVTIEGQGSWDKYFYVSYLDDQIKSLVDHIEWNRRAFFALVAVGVIFFAGLWSQSPVTFKSLFSFVNANWPTLVGKPLLEWLLTLGAAIPACISFFQCRLFMHGNEQLRSLQSMKEMVKSADEMSPDLRKRLHGILEQSLRGAKAE